MSNDLAFIDIETTGLDFNTHEVWEVGLIVDDEEQHWFLPVDLGKADAKALEIGGYYERHPNVVDNSGNGYVSGLRQFAEDFEDWTRGKTLVGANPRFDEAFLAKLLKANGACPGWHFRLIDVEAQTQGALGLPKPLGLASSAKNLGVDTTIYEAHTALDDAKLARDVYSAALKLRR